MRRRLWVVFGLLLVLGLVLAGCGKQITAEEIIARMQETIENTEDAHAVVSVDINAQGIQASATAKVWEKTPNRFRGEVIESSRPEYAGMIMVSDGQRAWLYEPAKNRVMFGPVEQVETPLPQQMLNELQEVIQEVLEVSDVELVGEEAVAGQEAYKLTLTPREDVEQKLFPGNGVATLWVDKEQWIILKATYDGGTFGQGTMEIQSYELNPGLSDDLFQFQVPEGAEVIDIESQQPLPLTLDEAREQAGFQVLVPGYVPNGATLIEVYKMGDSFILRYDHSREVSFTVIEGQDLLGPTPLGESQEITVRGESATAITDEANGNTFLYWTEDGVTITIAGHLSLDEALRVAESLQ